MKVTSSYAMKLTGDLKALEKSITIYRNALSFIIPLTKITLVTTLTKHFRNFLHIYAGLHSMMRLASSPLIVVT